MEILSDWQAAIIVEAFNLGFHPAKFNFKRMLNSKRLYLAWAILLVCGCAVMKGDRQIPN